MSECAASLQWSDENLFHLHYASFGPGVLYIGRAMPVEPENRRLDAAFRGVWHHDESLSPQRTGRLNLADCLYFHADGKTSVRKTENICKSIGGVQSCA
ncbi:hypothetical protein [Burkholderia diffusa]|uniref:hypothetical protein n=1 Tax=Burkholderia diffusa TaxID=488732 RepID=UPI0012D8B185|nr:hypothetical protein [Burkholderia diffusa]